MKQVILAAIAATFVFASAVQAAAPADASNQQANAAMSTEDCAKAMADCKDDQACKDALVKDHGCKAEG